MKARICPMVSCCVYENTKQKTVHETQYTNLIANGACHSGKKVNKISNVNKN